MLILIILLPLLGFFSGSFFGRYLGRTVCVITTLNTSLALIFSLFLIYDVTSAGIIYKVQACQWIAIDTININWCFCFDSLTSIMLIVVTFISTLVHLYSTEYMAHDPHLARFMSYLSLFTFFMLILITANNFLQLFVGWEGVGLCSYLLINFWFTRIQANKAAIKAMLVNRVGDFFLLLALFTIYFVFNSLDYDVVFGLAPLVVNNKILIGSTEIPVLDSICLLLFLGAMGKSAQLGFHTWLPDAMEGPTPVSALIHAATMVTAGVFLIIRCSYLFEFSYLVLNFVIFIGSATAFFAATTGLFQNDMKRVIAYSTCSQLGYMVFACGLSSYEVGVFHLSNHAFFKALLFLGAGSVLHAMADEQDMRNMGGLKRVLPLSYSIMLIGSLALMGFPFLTGFYSKDVILEVAYAKYTILGHYSYYLGTFAAFFTSFYSIRLLFLVFLSEPNGNKKTIINAQEGSWQISLCLFILAIFSITVGFLTRDFFIGVGTSFFGTSIFVLPQNHTLLDIEFIPLQYKLLPLVLSFFGASLAYLLHSFELSSFYSIKSGPQFKSIYNFLNKKWYFDRIYNEIINQNVLHVGHHYTYKDIDRGLIEKIGPSGVIETIIYIFRYFKALQSGVVFHYLFMFLISIFLLILFLVFFSFFQIPSIMIFFILGYFFFEKNNVISKNASN
jgi:proton-translocating NADH-quinone oxidoreductase chain L